MTKKVTEKLVNDYYRLLNLSAALDLREVEI